MTGHGKFSMALTPIEWISLFSTLSGQNVRNTFKDLRKLFNAGNNGTQSTKLIAQPVTQLLRIQNPDDLTGVWQLAMWNYQFKEGSQWIDTRYNVGGKILIIYKKTELEDSVWKGVIHLKYYSTGLKKVLPFLSRLLSKKIGMLGKEGFEGFYEIAIRKNDTDYTGTTVMFARWPHWRKPSAGEMKFTLDNGVIEGIFYNTDKNPPSSRAIFRFQNRSTWAEIEMPH